ncbi:alpha-amylase family glycosyl hydrolase [Pendulispora albinea]|uniref:DUF3459 domain-containing protein n=1 Tax=Pendulispora albinea TaxID=2741071 RepID=A0ABZ2LV16_9BACT
MMRWPSLAAAILSLALLSPGGPATPHDGAAKAADGATKAADGMIVYGVIPPRFGSPPLRAVTQNLPALADLGVTTLWLTPIFESPPGDFGYAVTDYLTVREEYGTRADLDALVAEAHRLRLKVLLDLVPNHTSAKHPYFRDAAARGPSSPYFRFYQHDPRGAPVHYFDWSHLPNLNYDEPGVVRWMTDASLSWIRTSGIDGYRVDAAWGIRERTPSFWGAWTAQIRRARPDAILIAEASARDPFYAAQGFDASYDWTSEPGHWAWEKVFDDPDDIPERLDRALQETAARAPEARVLRFLENNDTGARFITRHGPNLARVAAAALLTLPGVPCLFTGQEVGAEYEPYDVNRVVHLDRGSALRDWYKKLIALRAARPSLRSRHWTRVPVSVRSVYAYVRTEGAERTLVVLQFGDQPVNVVLELPDRQDQSATWRDGVGGPSPRMDEGRMSLSLPRWGVAILGSN